VRLGSSIIPKYLNLYSSINLLISMEWFTESKAFFISMNTATVFPFGLSIHLNMLLVNSSAAGPDMIINEMWRYLDSVNRIILLDMVNEMWRRNSINTELTKTVIVPIFKKRDVKFPGNYRPINLVNTIVKVITSLMGNRCRGLGSVI